MKCKIETDRVHVGYIIHITQNHKAQVAAAVELAKRGREVQEGEAGAA